MLLEWNPTITAGELGVAVGTCALAAFTWRLATLTGAIDRDHHEREVCGIARLVDGELWGLSKSIEEALSNHEWTPYLPTPHRAWDHGGGAIVASIDWDPANQLIAVFTEVTTWEIIAGNRGNKFALTNDDKTQLHEMARNVSNARDCLFPLTVPLHRKQFLRAQRVLIRPFRRLVLWRRKRRLRD